MHPVDCWLDMEAHYYTCPSTYASVHTSATGSVHTRQDEQLPLAPLAHDIKMGRQSCGRLTFSVDGDGSGTAATALSMYVADLTLQVCNITLERQDSCRS